MAIYHMISYETMMSTPALPIHLITTRDSAIEYMKRDMCHGNHYSCRDNMTEPNTTGVPYHVSDTPCSYESLDEISMGEVKAWLLEKGLVGTAPAVFEDCISMIGDFKPFLAMGVGCTWHPEELEHEFFSALNAVLIGDA